MPLLTERRKLFQRIGAINIARLMALRHFCSLANDNWDRLSNAHRLRFVGRAENFRMENARKDFDSVNYARSRAAEV